ncbi:MAG: response regulator [Desulfomonilia bacterium]
MPKQVLIVDDEETLTWSLAKSLSHDRETYEVTTVNDGETALATFEDQTFDVVVLDIRLPGISGLDVLVKIKEKKPATKVIIMTAYGSIDVKEKARARGSLFYIEKPFEIEQMRGLILKALKEDAARGFAGSITGLQLPDLIQMNCLSQMTTALFVNKDERKGCIYFEDGQITHAEVGAIDGEEALFTILSWSTGSFKFMGGMKAPRNTIATNWEYLLIEGMRRADEMSLALERGEIEDSDFAPVDESTRALVKNLSSLNECTGIAVVKSAQEILYQSGNISKEVNLSFVAKFYMNLPEALGDLSPNRPKKVTFIDQGRLVLLFPFKIFALILLINRSVISQETSSAIERLITRYEV